MSMIVTLIADKNKTLLSPLIQKLTQAVETKNFPEFSLQPTLPSLLYNVQHLELLTSLSYQEIKEKIKPYLLDMPIDVFFQKEQLPQKKLILCDMESTIIAQEMLDEMAVLANVKDQVATITQKAMQGDINFEESLKERVSLFQGWHRNQFTSLKQKITYMPGAKDLITGLKAKGFKTALITGGFHEFADDVAEDLGFDYVQANRFDWQDDTLTGTPIFPIQGPTAKLDALKTLAAEFSLSLDQTIAIGDGANDIPMLEAAGLGIGIYPKPIVEEKIPNTLKHAPLSALLELLP